MKNVSGFTEILFGGQVESMNNDQLSRSLQSIGMACFVKYFQQFSDKSLSNDDLIGILMRQESYAKSGCITRVTQARKIIANEKSVVALRLVEKSVRISDEVSAEASRLARKLEY
jgi:hypothetical protein